MEIRPARPEELEEVGRITLQAYVADGYLSPEDPYAQRLLDAGRRSSDAEVWVAVEDEQVLGSVTFCPVGSAFREIARDDEGEFRMLAVSDDARGRGVGRGLVEHCLSRSGELGYRGVRMSSMDRMSAAHRVYERLGFIRVSQDDWTPEPGVRLLAYAMHLPDS
ncbi:MAG: GNAT family N-acetyltransferase [Candidatus Limnocylindrales bacterium]